jgi:hypothetical protein
MMIVVDVTVIVMVDISGALVVKFLSALYAISAELVMDVDLTL